MQIRFGFILVSRLLTRFTYKIFCLNRGWISVWGREVGAWQAHGGQLFWIKDIFKMLANTMNNTSEEVHILV